MVVVKVLGLDIAAFSGSPGDGSRFRVGYLGRRILWIARAWQDRLAAGH